MGEFSYSGDPRTSRRDAIRFLVQDTDEGSKLLDDAEIDYLIDAWWPTYPSVLYVASAAAGVVARKFAMVVSVSGDGVSVGTADIFQRYTDLAASLRAEWQSESAPLGAPDIENLLVGSHFDSSIAPLAFSRGIHDNPSAGYQDIGGWDRPQERP